MTTETAAEIGRKRLVDSSELKKKIYTYTYIKNSCPFPSGSRQLPPAGRRERVVGRRRPCLRFPRAPCLQFQCQGPGCAPLGRGKGPPSPGLGCRCSGPRAMLWAPSPLPGRCPCQGGWARPRRLVSLAAVCGATQGQVSEAAESRPGCRQPLPPPDFVF